MLVTTELSVIVVLFRVWFQASRAARRDNRPGTSYCWQDVIFHCCKVAAQRWRTDAPFKVRLEAESGRGISRHGADVSRDIKPFLYPRHLYSALEILSRPCPVPNSSGVYAWYFDAPLPLIDMKGAIGWTVAILPNAPSLRGSPSRSMHRKRVRARG